MEIPIGFAHPLIQDLSVKLTSPSGTTSSLFIPSTHPISSNSRYAINVIRGIWTFGSSVHLGEDPSGVWKLRFEDTRATTGTLIEWGMRIRGYQIKNGCCPCRWVIRWKCSRNSIDFVSDWCKLGKRFAA